MEGIKEMADQVNRDMTALMVHVAVLLGQLPVDRAPAPQTTFDAIKRGCTSVRSTMGELEDRCKDYVKLSASALPAPDSDDEPISKRKQRLDAAKAEAK